LEWRPDHQAHEDWLGILHEGLHGWWRGCWRQDVWLRLYVRLEALGLGLGSHEDVLGRQSSPYWSVFPCHDYGSWNYTHGV
jgi:hypothetical protein